jgi:hypothetical protein
LLIRFAITWGGIPLVLVAGVRRGNGFGDTGASMCGMLREAWAISETKAAGVRRRQIAKT